MVDPLSVIAFAYPVAKELSSLAKNIKKACTEIYHAKKHLERVIERTMTVAETYTFFRDTIKEARKIHELHPMFRKYKRLINRVDGESSATVQKLRNVRSIFSPLGREDPVHPAEKWMAQIRWYRKGNKTIIPLFQDMEVLEQSMRTIGTLVQIHILKQIYLKDRSNAILAQVKCLGKMLHIEFDKLHHAQKSQEGLLRQNMLVPSHDIGTNDFAQAILKELRKEMRHLYRDQPPGSPSTSDSRPSSSSPNSHRPSPTTPPSSPPRQNAGNRGPAVRPQFKKILSPSVEGPRERLHQTRDPPLSTTRSLRGVEVDTLEEGPDDTDNKEQTGPYMPMPPFGLPMLGPRPRAGRTLDSSDGEVQSESRPPRSANRGPLQQNRGSSSSRANRRNGSIISVYGNDGEVTPTHLTGSLGLQSGYERKKRPSRGWDETP
ncbi:hypothetical protein BDV24DRAFT_158631 [Aspergillus arachidicola]|uniref:Uncharacterized protein n=1 Tax=Aspergillus arachidicola TaxID=656916 RepID=A0A5N6YLL6_9EURO|nr:hypothetical protein BDV24DRAFT_158631 [Aspergillus arachidicola]